MSLPFNPSHFTAYQVIVNAIKNISSVIDTRVNRVRLLLAVLPKLDYSHPQAYRDPWRHK
jgi:hypothetical protein